MEAVLFLVRTQVKLTVLQPTCADGLQKCGFCGLADRAEIQLAYAIGHRSQPASSRLFWNQKVEESKIEKAVQGFSFKPEML